MYEGNGKMREVISALVVAVPALNEVTNDGVVTALALEDTSWLGLTFGAWFKVFMFVALILLIVERVVSIRNKIRVGV